MTPPPLPPRTVSPAARPCFVIDRYFYVFFFFLFYMFLARSHVLPCSPRESPPPVMVVAVCYVVAAPGSVHLLMLWLQAGVRLSLLTLLLLEGDSKRRAATGCESSGWSLGFILHLLHISLFPPLFFSTGPAVGFSNSDP